MNRALLLAVFLVWRALADTSTLSAGEKTIEGFTASGKFFWQPVDTDAFVGDVIEWKNGVGDHGLRITNWADVNPHVDIETVAGQQPFNARTGRNGSSTNTSGKLLLRLKIKSVPPAAIKFDCIVHGVSMSGTVTVAATPPGPIALMSRLDMAQAMMVPSCSGGYFLIAPSQADNGRLMAVPVDVFESVDTLGVSEATAESVTIVRSLTRPLRWENNAAQIEIGDEIQWVNGGGPHGLRITNWNDVHDSIEVIEAHGSPENFRQTGETPSSSAINRVYARLRVNSIPAETDTIEYNCVLHGNAMAGTVQIIPATELPADESHSVQR
jgi:plastocyanin